MKRTASAMICARRPAASAGSSASDRSSAVGTQPDSPGRSGAFGIAGQRDLRPGALHLRRDGRAAQDPIDHGRFNRRGGPQQAHRLADDVCGRRRGSLGQIRAVRPAEIAVGQPHEPPAPVLQQHFHRPAVQELADLLGQEGRCGVQAGEIRGHNGLRGARPQDAHTAHVEVDAWQTRAESGCHSPQRVLIQHGPGQRAAVTVQRHDLQPAKVDARIPIGCVTSSSQQYLFHQTSTPQSGQSRFQLPVSSFQFPASSFQFPLPQHLPQTPAPCSASRPFRSEPRSGRPRRAPPG